MNIIVKKYDGYNRSLGKYIRSKSHYVEEMKKGGYIPYEQACEIAEKARASNKKEYRVSDKAMGIIKSVKDTADRKGNVKLGSRAINAMKEVGVKFNMPDSLPKHYRDGGFYG